MDDQAEGGAISRSWCIRAIRWTRRALLQTQRNLYNIALFNEVVAAVQNPAGRRAEKNVLLQLTEAKRWNVTYGFGFEAQTGTPQSGHDLGGVVHTADS